MAAAATEYAITKVGMTIQSKNRGKPLRTYGRRNQAAAHTESEPPAKRQRSGPTTSPNKQPGAVETQCAATTPAAIKTESEEARVGPPKQSILSYFKKVEMPVQSEDMEDSEEDAVVARRRTTRRKPRVLRLRMTANDDNNEEAGEQTSTTSSPMSTKTSPSPDKENLKPAAKRKRNAAPSVQTTLNISSQAAFSECKVCDCVYNPLFPDDVKYHQKRHASVVRAKKKKESLEL